MMWSQFEKGSQKRRAALAKRRAAGAQDRSASAVVWEVLNKPLVILIISSVFLTGGARLYANFEARSREDADRKEEAQSLFEELENRDQELEPHAIRLERAEIYHLLETEEGEGLNTDVACILAFNSFRKLGFVRSQKSDPRHHFKTSSKVLNWRDNGQNANEVIQQERASARDVLGGSPPYHPTDAKYKEVSSATIARKLDRLVGDSLSETGSIGRDQLELIQFASSMRHATIELQPTSSSCKAAGALSALHTYLEARDGGMSCIRNIAGEYFFCPRLNR